MIGERICDILFDSVIEINGVLILNNRVLYSRNESHEIKYLIGVDCSCVPNFTFNQVYFINGEKFEENFKTPFVPYR